jgi:hypothetical protein
MKMRVVKHEADDEKDNFRVILKGQDGQMVDGCLIECELRLKCSYESILEQFPRGMEYDFTPAKRA